MTTQEMAHLRNELDEAVNVVKKIQRDLKRHDLTELTFDCCNELARLASMCQLKVGKALGR